MCAVLYVCSQNNTLYPLKGKERVFNLQRELTSLSLAILIRHQRSVVTFLRWGKRVFNGQSHSKSSEAPLESSQQNFRQGHRTSEAPGVPPCLVTVERTTTRLTISNASANQAFVETRFYLDLHTDRAQGSFSPLAASLCCVNSRGVPSVLHWRQSGMDILLWPWSPPMLFTPQTQTKTHI